MATLASCGRQRFEAMQPSSRCRAASSQSLPEARILQGGGFSARGSGGARCDVAALA